MPARKAKSKARNTAAAAKTKPGSKVAQPQQQPRPTKTKRQPGAARSSPLTVEEVPFFLASPLRDHRDKGLPAIPPQSPIEISFRTAGGQETRFGRDRDRDSDVSEYSEREDPSPLEIRIDDMLAELGGQGEDAADEDSDWPVIHSAFPWRPSAQFVDPPSKPMQPWKSPVRVDEAHRLVSPSYKGDSQCGKMIQEPADEVKEPVFFFDDHLELLAESTADGLVALPNPPGLEDTPVVARDPLDCEDVLQSILEHLELGDLCRAALVNSTWNAVTTRLLWRDVSEQGLRRILLASPDYEEDGDAISLSTSADWTRFRQVIAPCIETLSLDARSLLEQTLLRQLLDNIGKLSFPRMRRLDLKLHAYDRNQVELAMRFAGECVSRCSMTVWWRSRYVVPQAALVLNGINDRMRGRMPLLDEFRFNVEWECPFDDPLDVIYL